MQTMLSVSLALALLGGQLAAQALTFGDFTWTFIGPASSSGFVTPELMHVTGPSWDCIGGNYAAFTTTAPFAGTVRAWIHWDTEDDCYFDWPGYFLNGQFVPGEIDYTCWSDGIFALQFAVQAGDVFGLGVNASDCGFGPGIADFTDFTLLPPDWIDAGGVLDPRLELDVAAPDPLETFRLSLVAIGTADGARVADLAVAGHAPPLPSHEAVHLLSGAQGALLWSADGPLGALPRLAAMGDVTGDGLPDVALGSISASSVRMLSGADGSVHWTWTWSGSSLDSYGLVAAPADVDGDGILDLAVGSGESAGLPVRISSGSTGAELSLIQPPPGVANFGYPLGAPGDLDGDGIGELMVGELGATTQISVVSGASGTELLALHAPGDPTSWKVSILAGIGDWDLDGVPDMAVGAPYDYDGPYGGLGTVALYSGATGDLLLLLKAPHGLRDFGAALAGGVDLTGDGAPELAIGAPSSLVYMGTEVTHVQIVRAPDGAVVQEITDTALSDLGRSLAWQTGAATPTLAVARTGVAEPGHLLLYSDLLHPGGKPWLFMHGNMSSGLPWTVRVDHGLPDNLALLCLGLSAVSLPFKGGVLVPAADLVVSVVLDASGVFEQSADAPAGITPVLSLWLQAWMPDAAGPKGWSATRAQMSPPP